jgi:hypothetical protein
VFIARLSVWVLACPDDGNWEIFGLAGLLISVAVDFARPSVRVPAFTDVVAAKERQRIDKQF